MAAFVNTTAIGPSGNYFGVRSTSPAATAIGTQHISIGGQQMSVRFTQAALLSAQDGQYGTTPIASPLHIRGGNASGDSGGGGRGGDLLLYGGLKFGSTSYSIDGHIILQHNGSSALTSNVGVKTVDPTQDLDINGDAYIRDSLRLTTTPDHTAITGVLTRDANGWVGRARLGTDFVYAGDSIRLASAGVATNIYTANGALTSNRTLTGGGFDLRLDTDVTIGDSLRVVTLPNHADPDSIATVKDGVIGKKKFLMPASDAYDGTSTGFFNDDFALGYQTSGNNYFHLDYADTTGYWQKITANLSYDAYSGFYGTTRNGATSYTAAAVSDGNGNFIINFVRPDRGVVVSKFKNGVIGFTDIFQVDTFGTMRIQNYGTGTKEAADLGKTQSNYITSFATDGTVLDLERKRDTTIYIDDTDYDWSAAITTAQIARRFNRVIFWMTTTAAAGSDSELTLHTPDANLLQVEYLIHSVDEPAGFDNKIVFGTNNAVDSTNGLVTNYYPAAGDGIHVRAGLRSGVYKYRYSN